MAKIVTKLGIAEKGKVIVPAGKFEEITPVIFDNGDISDKLFIVKDDDGEHVLLISEKEINGYAVYGPVSRLGSINNNCIVVSDYDERHGEKWAIIATESLEELTKYKYDYISPISETMYSTKEDGLFGVINNKGEVVLPNMFTSILYNESNGTFQIALYTPDN